MWEGLSLPHDTKFGNCRCKIVDSRSFHSWSLIHGLRWSGFIKVGPGVNRNMEGNQSKDILNDTNWEHGRDRYERYQVILHAYVCGPLILAGVVGNIIAFRTLGRFMRQNVTTFLLRGLAISDISVLLIFVIYVWSGNAAHFHLPPATMAVVLDANIYICSILQIFSMVNVWMTVVVGMNRYIALCRPLDATRLCTISRARKHMIYIVLVSIAVGLPGFFYHKKGRPRMVLPILSQWCQTTNGIFTSTNLDVM